MTLLTVVALWWTVLDVYGNDAQGNHAVWGIGQTSCHGYNRARAASGFGEHKAYLMGYLTAYNTFTPNTYNVAGSKDLNGILAWLDEYCKKNAIDSFERALSQMVATFHETRSATAQDQPWGKLPASNDTK